MDLTRYFQLRDRIAERLNALANDSFQRITRVAVLPNGVGVAERPREGAAIHFASRLPDEIAKPAIRSVIEDAGLTPHDFSLVRAPCEMAQWTAPWSLTACPSGGTTPMLLLKDCADGTVDGVLLHQPTMTNLDGQIAASIYEPEDVIAFFEAARHLGADAPFFGGFKSRNVTASSVDEAIASCAQGDSGPIFVVVYRNDEWFCDLWNTSPSLPQSPLKLESIARMNGLRTTASVTARRPGLETAKARQTLAGAPAVLKRAIASSELDAPHHGRGDGFDHPHPATRILCGWWNAHAPESERQAAFFKVYVWDDASRWFLPGDTEEPAMDASEFEHSFAIFDACDGIPRTTAIVFFRRLEVVPDDRFIQFHYADGTPSHDIGISHAEAIQLHFDEPDRGVTGLSELALEGEVDDFAEALTAMGITVDSSSGREPPERASAMTRVAPVRRGDSTFFFRSI